MSDASENGHQAEFHPKPSPHMVVSEDVWEYMKAADLGRGDTTIAGQIGFTSGLPVYLNECPNLWHCKESS